MTANTLYRSVFLDRLTATIRLVRLNKDQSDDMISCTMECFNLYACPEYTALSYAWGDPDIVSTIVVDRLNCRTAIRINGMRHKVRANLWEFLLHRWQVKDTGYYWVDAICIDQNNADEKTHQVNLMKDIYPKAAMVLVWLGRGADESGVAMACLRELKTYWGKFPKQKANMVPPWTQDQVHAILSLWERTYWSRVWILQEIVLAKHLMVVCGDESLEWQYFEDLSTKLAYLHAELQSDFFKSEDESDLLYSLMSSRAAHIIEHRRFWAQQKNFWNIKIPSQKMAVRDIATRASSLRNALEITAKLDCEDVRDKVYGLLGMIKIIDPKQIKEAPATTADYSKSTSKIYIEVLMYLDTSHIFRNKSEKERFALMLESALGLIGSVRSSEHAKAEKEILGSSNRWSQYEKTWFRYLRDIYPSIIDDSDNDNSDSNSEDGDIWRGTGIDFSRLGAGLGGNTSDLELDDSDLDDFN